MVSSIHIDIIFASYLLIAAIGYPLNSRYDNFLGMPPTDIGQTADFGVADRLLLTTIEGSLPLNTLWDCPSLDSENCDPIFGGRKQG